MSYHELAGLVEFRPLSEPAERYREKVRSSFSAPLRSTVGLLSREIRHLRPKRTILEADFTEGQLRQDGLPRASAIPASSGVVLTLVGTPHGDLRYPCHTFRHWEDNLRGIALALEALRKVDRYGVTKRGEQYAGWKALPAGSGPSAEKGARLIREHGSVAKALYATHPDTSGYDSAGDFADVQAARELEEAA